MKGLKGVVEDVAHGECVHALAVQVIDVSARIEQQVDDRIVAVNLRKTNVQTYKRLNKP